MQTIFFIVIAITTAVLAVPALLLAKAFKAQRPKYGYAFTATFFILLAGGGIQLMSVSQQIQYSLVLFSGAFIYGYFFRLRLLKSFVIALVVSILHLAIAAAAVPLIIQL